MSKDPFTKEEQFRIEALKAASKRVELHGPSIAELLEEANQLERWLRTGEVAPEHQPVR